MDSLSWSTALQAVILAVCTWYMRQGSVKDRENVKRNTSTPEDVAQVKAELKEVRAELNILKDAYFKANPVKIDHRGPGEKR